MKFTSLLSLVLLLSFAPSYCMDGDSDGKPIKKLFKEDTKKDDTSLEKPIVVFNESEEEFTVREKGIIYRLSQSRGGTTAIFHEGHYKIKKVSVDDDPHIACWDQKLLNDLRIKYYF